MILLLLFIGHYGSITLFYHTHTIDSVIYCHSHFNWFDDASNPIPLLPHSKEQLELIQDFNQITWELDTYAPKLNISVFAIIAKTFPAETTQSPFDIVVHYPLRAPPALV